MSAVMFSDPGRMVAIVLALVVVVSIARLLAQHWRAAPALRAQPWRFALLLLAQPICATLLYFALLPPTTPGEAGTLVVATAGTRLSDIGAGQGGDAVVALPEAPPLTDVERVPDLATALRRHPGMQRLRIVGAGLEARDRDGVRGLAVDFRPTPLPRGLVELDAPSNAVAGNAFRIDGSAHELRGGVAELLDPGRARVDRVVLSDDGRFGLGATTRVPGAAVFTLRLRDANGRVVEDIGVPLQVEASPAPRVLLLAGAPGPEVKYLRRWARDAGVPMQAQMTVGGGVQLGDTPIALNADTLKRFDVVVLDERAWSALGPSQRAALTDAVRGGLGVLLRVTAALSDSERQRLRALGFVVADGRDAAQVRLAQSRRDDDALRARVGPGTRDQARRGDEAVPEAPALSRRDLQITAADGVPLLRDEAGDALAVWRAEGRGRIGVWTVTDSYRLVLAGRNDLHGELWSDALAMLARAQPGRSVVIEGERRVGERLTLCGVDVHTRVETQGRGTALLVDPAAGAGRCAAYWPREAGWHRVRDQRMQTFFVRAQDAAPGLHANLVREATLRAAVDTPSSAAVHAALPVPRHPGARWPWWAAWLLASAGLWWFERSRWGVVRVTEQGAK